MTVFLLLVLCVLNGILARPGISRIKRQSEIVAEDGGISKQTECRENPTWPESPDMYHLPKMFSLEHEIAIVVDIGNSKRLNVSLVTGANDPEAPALFTFMADLDSSSFAYIHNDDVIQLSQNSFIKGTELYASFIRRENRYNQEPNILHFGGEFNEAVINMTSNMDDIKYVKVSGDKIKVKRIEFKFV